MRACLSNDDLNAFVRNAASEQKLSAWSIHLESCDTCAARLARRQNALSSADRTGESNQEQKADADQTVTVKPPGKGGMDGRAYANGRRLEPGAKLA